MDVMGGADDDLVGGAGYECGDLALHLLPDGFVELGQLGWDVAEGQSVDEYRHRYGREG